MYKISSICFLLGKCVITVWIKRYLICGVLVVTVAFCNVTETQNAINKMAEHLKRGLSEKTSEENFDFVNITTTFDEYCPGGSEAFEVTYQ